MKSKANKTRMTFANNLRIALAARKIKGQLIAKKLGVTRQSVSNWLRGENEPSLETLVTIAETLQISIDELLGVTQFAVVQGNVVHGNQNAVNGSSVVVSTECPNCKRKDEVIANLSEVLKNLRK